VLDISQRKQAEEHILIQRDLALKLAGMCSLEKALSLCLDTALKVSQMESGGIYVKNRQTGDLELACSSGLSNAFEKTVSLVKVDSTAYRVVMAGKPVYRLPRQEGAVPFRTEVLTEGFLATAAIPVLHNGEVIACINLGSRTLDSLPLVASATLELIAMQLGTIFTRIQAEQELREREEHFSLIFQSNPGAMLLTTADGRCLDVNQSFVEIVRLHAGRGVRENDFGIGIMAVKERRETTAAHVRKRGSIRNHETRVRTKKGELKDVLASVAVITRRGNEYLLTMFHDVTERKRAEMQLLIQRNLALDLAATSSLDEVLSLCLERAVQVSGMDCGSIHLTNPDTDDLELRVHKGLSEEFVHLVSLLKAHSKIWSLSTQRGKVAFLPAEQMNEAIRPHVLKEGIGFVIGVPVRYRGRCSPG
jgi:PAS domain S-box-containing protein